MAFMAVLESDLRALSAEARRRYPAVKDGAEHAIIKVFYLLLKFLFSPHHFRCFFFNFCLNLILFEFLDNAVLQFGFLYDNRLLRSLNHTFSLLLSKDATKVN